MLPSGRVRGCAARRAQRAWCAGAHRLPGLAPVPGRHSAADVRAPGQSGGAAARRLCKVGRQSSATAHDGSANDWRQSRYVDQAVDRHRRELTARVVQLAVPLGFFALFFAWPVGAILRRSLEAGAIHDTLADPALRHIMWFTLWQAVVSTILTLLVGLPAAFVVARYEFRGKRLFRAFVTVPFVLPTVVVATAFLTVLRPGGLLSFLGWQRGIAPLLVAHVFFNVAVVVRTVGGFWANLDPRRVEAARMLGASRWRAFTNVTL